MEVNNPMTSPQDHKHTDDDKLIADIKTYGWVVMAIGATDYQPQFAYTVGLWKTYNHPELICFGLSPKTLHSILNSAGRLVRDGQRLHVGRDYDDFFSGGTAQFINVDPRNLNDYFGYAVSFNGKADFPALQLVWTDRNKRYPWEENFEEALVYQQPLLDRQVRFQLS